MVSRILTIVVAVAGGVISFYADNIQQLLSIFFVVGSGAAVVGVVRWLWWRINAVGELAAFVVNYVVAVLLLFGGDMFGLEQPLFDPIMAQLLNLPDGVSFTADYDLLGARMLFMTLVGLICRGGSIPPYQTHRDLQAEGVCHADTYFCPRLAQSN